MTFDNPFFFWLLLLPLVLFIIRTYQKKSRKSSSQNFPQGRILFAKTSSLKRHASSLKVELAKIVFPIIEIIIFVLIIFCLARPQTSSTVNEIVSSGRDIMLVLDTSGSMQAVDFTLGGDRVTRIEALKSVVQEFIDKRPGDRIGVVVFGQQAFTQCPLTIDHQVLKQFIGSIEVNMAGTSTAIGDGLAVALKRMKDISAKSRVVVLVTDGDNNAGTLNPSQAGELAKNLGVKVHTIVIGENGLVPFPQKTIWGTIEVVQREVKIDETAMKELSAQTGGEFFQAKDTQRLRGIYQEIDKLELRDDKSFQYVTYEELFQKFLLVALVLLVLKMCLSLTWFSRFP